MYEKILWGILEICLLFYECVLCSVINDIFILRKICILLMIVDFFDELEKINMFVFLLDNLENYLRFLRKIE